MRHRKPQIDIKLFQSVANATRIMPRDIEYAVNDPITLVTGQFNYPGRIVGRYNSNYLVELEDTEIRLDMPGLTLDKYPLIFVVPVTDLRPRAVLTMEDKYA